MLGDEELGRANVVAADPVLSRELKSLREELSAPRRERQSAPVHDVSAGEKTAAPANQAEDTGEEQQQRHELREFVNTITEFFKEAEKDVSAHPTASVIGAMVVGILIGRLLGRRWELQHDR